MSPFERFTVVVLKQTLVVPGKSSDQGNQSGGAFFTRNQLASGGHTVTKLKIQLGVDHAWSEDSDQHTLVRHIVLKLTHAEIQRALAHVVEVCATLQKWLAH